MVSYQRHDTRDTWLAARLDGFGIGASATPKILGMSPYGGPWDVWCAHHAPELSRPVQDYVLDGADLEAAVVKIYARREGLTLDHHDLAIYRHARIPWLRFSPDATEGPIEAPTRAFEIKAVMSPEVAPILPPSGPMPLDRFPVAHWPYQCLHQLAVLPSLQEVVLVALLPWFEIRTYTLRRDPWTRKAMAHVMAQVRDWRQVYLVEGKRPATDGSEACSQWHDWMNPVPDDWGSTKSKDRVRRAATDKEAEAAYAYNAARQAAGRADGDARRLRNELLATVGDAHKLDLPCGGTLTVTAHQHRQLKVEDLREGT